MRRLEKRRLKREEKRKRKRRDAEEKSAANPQALVKEAALNEYFAADGEAWKQVKDSEPAAISTRPAPEAALTVVASRDHAGPEVASIIDRVEADGRAVDATSMGSSLKFCLVAEGAADFYPRTVPTFEWDTAAAQAVVEAAGGRVGTRASDRLRYNKDDLRNPSVFAWGDPSLDWRRWLGDGG